MDKKNLALILALLSFSTWGGLVLYWHYLANVNPLEVASHRALWSFVFTGILIIILRKANEVKYLLKNPKNIVPLIVASILIATNGIIFISAVGKGKVVEISMGNYITPLFNVLASSFLFKAKLDKWQLISVFLAFSGVVYMVIVYGRVPYVAIFYSLTYCFYGIIKKLVTSNVLVGVFVETFILFIPASLYILYLILTGKSALLEKDVAISTLLILSGIVTTLPLLGFAFSTRILQLSTIGILQYITPTLSFLLGVFVFHEYFSVNMLITFIFIWSGLIIFTLDGIHKMRLSHKR